LTVPIGRTSISVVKESEFERILIDSLSRLGVTIRREEIEHGPGGFCRLDREPLIVYSPGLSQSKRIELFLNALKRLDTSGIFLPPVVRDKLEQE